MTDTLERVKTYQQFIGGEFVDAADGRTAEVINPANDQVIANVPASSTEDVDRAVNAAATAFETWKNTTPQDRSLLLLKIADALEAKGDELGRLESANAGKPVGAAIDEMAVCADLFRFFAGAARVMDGLAANEFAAGHTSIIRRDPIGVVASIAPWNYPLYMASLEARPGARDRQHGRPQAVRADAADRPGLRRDPRRKSSRPASSTSCRAPAPRSATRSSGIRRSGWSRSPATPSPASASRRSRPRPSSGSTWSSAARRRSSSSTTPTSTSRPRPSGPPATGTPARTAPRPRASSPDPKVYDNVRLARSADQVRPIKWGDPAEGDDIEMGSLIAQAQADKVQGMVDRARGRRRDRASAASDRTVPGAYYAPTVIAGPGPEVRDHPGRDLRPGRHGPAVQRRGAGRPVGERHARTGSRRRSSRATSAGRCASRRRSSSGTSGSTSTSR